MSSLRPDADLRGTILLLANFDGADLRGADLSDADLRVDNLTQEQLDQACGNADTKPPEGLTLKVMCK